MCQPALSKGSGGRLGLAALEETRHEVVSAIPESKGIPTHEFPPL
jgi:hypothetical protein